MTSVEGRALAGLDEFMLRPGHLSVLCYIAEEIGGSWSRIQREASSFLANPQPVEPADNAAVAQYLAAKSLCKAVRRADGRLVEIKDPLYPDLEVSESTDGEWSVASITQHDEILVSWQDCQLADPAVRSKVGGISSTGKFGSKTGLSHVCDWAQLLELIDSSGKITPIGRLVVPPGEGSSLGIAKNPYVLGSERVAFAYQYITKDFDIFSRLLKRLAVAKDPLTRATCRKMFVESLLECANDADNSPMFTGSSRFSLMQQIRDLEKAARSSKKTIDETSTAWHRAASRVEMLTDIGFLTKDDRSQDDKYRYVYFASDALHAAVRLLEGYESADSWIEANLINVLSVGRGSSSVSGADDPSRLLAEVAHVASSLHIPTSQYPIDCLTIGVAIRDFSRGQTRSLASLRAGIESLATHFPEEARLARGRTGVRAEYISLDLRKLAS